MNKKELIQSFLEKMGYPFKEDSEGDLEVTYQMKEIYLILSGDEEAYVSMLLPFHSVEEDKITFELAVCNRLNRRLNESTCSWHHRPYGADSLFIGTIRIRRLCIRRRSKPRC